MNMHTTIETTISGDVASPRAERLWFRDELGNPSARAGPDLTKAEPIERVIRSLTRARATFSVQFYRACQASGINLSVVVHENGEEVLYMGYPCDVQEDLRRERGRALEKVLHSTERRRQDVIDLVNMLGLFADNQPFESVEVAAREFIAKGGSIELLRDGSWKEQLPATADAMMEDSWDGYPRRRVAQRFNATMRTKGAASELAALVARHGTIHEGGSIVWREEQ